MCRARATPSIHTFTSNRIRTSSLDRSSRQSSTDTAVPGAGAATRQYSQMKDKADALASSWLTRIERDARRIAGHRFVLELALALGAAALSIVGLASQHRLDATTLVFCAALCVPLLSLRRDPRLCFAVV